MIKFREHRGGLAESLDTTVTIEDRQDLIKHIQLLVKPWDIEVVPQSIHVQYYGNEQRAAGWNNMHIVTIDGHGVIGFTDQFVEV